MKKKVFNFVNFLESSKVGLIIFIEIAFGIIMSLFSFLIFLDIGKDVLENDYVHLDSLISNFIYSFRSPILTDIMLFISFLGKDTVIVASLIIIILMILKKHKREAFTFSVISFFGLILNLVLKQLIQRPRPEIASLIQETSYSFPSTHTMSSFVFYALIAYFIFHFTRKKKLSLIISFFSIILIVLIGISRIYLGVHYPSDVFAALFAGFWLFVTALVIERTLIFFKLFKESKEHGNN